ncbi:MAG: response regulator [Anaerolineae bacterium]|nr:response regulator [Anaerolineae bacterium]
MRNRVIALLLTKPGPLQDSLTTLLLSMPQIATVKYADSAATALAMIGMHHPEFMIIDASLPGGQVWNLLAQVRARWPQMQCIVLADTTQHRQHAIAAGADYAVFKGYPAAKLSFTIEQILR